VGGVIRQEPNELRNFTARVVLQTHGIHVVLGSQGRGCTSQTVRRARIRDQAGDRLIRRMVQSVAQLIEKEQLR